MGEDTRLLQQKNKEIRLTKNIKIGKTIKKYFLPTKIFQVRYHNYVLFTMLLELNTSKSHVKYSPPKIFSWIFDRIHVEKKMQFAFEIENPPKSFLAQKNLYFDGITPNIETKSPFGLY